MASDEIEAFRKACFQAAQSPSNWLTCAERLRDAAEVIFKSEASREVEYRHAYAVAVDEANKGDGKADIQCDPPNYLPGQMLRAFAVENALKGLIVAGDPSLKDGTKLNDLISRNGHDLVDLAKRANFALDYEEVRVLAALSALGEWAGRYPTATRLTKHTTVQPLSDPHELLAYGADHTVVRQVLTRAIAALSTAVGPRQFRYGTVVLVGPTEEP
jgi:hypothetical protein